MSTALTTTSAAMLPDAAQLQAMLTFADTLLKSGLLPKHIETPAAAFAVIQKGRELNIPPMLALSNIIVVQGKPTANAELMAGLIHRDHGDDALHFVAADCTEAQAVLLYKRRGWAKYERFAFTIEDAKRASLIKQSGPWQQYPGAMLRARAISAVARMAFADSIGGLFTPEELGATVSVTTEGEIVVEDIPHENTNPVTGEITSTPMPQLAPAEPMTTPSGYKQIRDQVFQLQMLLGDEAFALTDWSRPLPEGLTKREGLELYNRVKAAVAQAEEAALERAL